MHPVYAEQIVKRCRERAQEGDCPTVARPGPETMEFCILELASQRDDARNAALEEAAVMLKASYPDNANTNAFCAAIRSLKTAPR